MDPIEKELVRRIFQAEYDGAAMDVLSYYGIWLCAKYLSQITKELIGITNLLLTKGKPSFEIRKKFIGIQIFSNFRCKFEDPVICEMVIQMIEVCKSEEMRNHYTLIADHSSGVRHSVSGCFCLNAYHYYETDLWTRGY